MNSTIKNIFPERLASKIGSTFPTENIPCTEYEKVQTIEVFDPREYIGYMDFEFGDKVLIKRVITHIPKNEKMGMELRLTYTLDIIKEYSFEEWDKGLEQ